MWPERSLPQGSQSPGSVTPLLCRNPRDTRPRFAALGSSQLVAVCNVPGRGFQMGSSCFNAFFACVCGFRTSLCLIPFPTYAPPLITGECHSEGKLFTAQVKKGSRCQFWTVPLPATPSVLRGTDRTGHSPVSPVSNPRAGEPVTRSGDPGGWGLWFVALGPAQPCAADPLAPEAPRRGRAPSLLRGPLRVGMRC